MFNRHLCVKSVKSYLTQLYAFLLSCSSLLPSSPDSIFKIAFYLLVLCPTVETLTVMHRSQMSLYQKRIERSVLIYSEDHDVLPSMYLRSTLIELEKTYLIESENQIGFAQENFTRTKDGHFLITLFPMDLIAIFATRTVVDYEVVSIKKSYSETYICMNLNGSIYTQVILNMITSGDCAWYLEKSAFGLRFISFRYSENIRELWYMAACKLSQYKVCSQVGKNGNMYSNTFWTCTKINTLKLVQVPSPISRQRFNYQSLSAAIQLKSIILCNDIKNDITTVAFGDIEESLRTMKQIKTTLAYLRFFLLSHSFSRRDVKIILQNIKEIINFYGFKTKRKLFRIFKTRLSKELCSLQYLKLCSSFRIRNRWFKQRRRSFKENSHLLVRTLMPVTNFNYLEKQKYLKNGDILDFIRDGLSKSLPPTKRIRKASYILMQYLGKEDVFKVDSEEYKDSKYFDIIFSRKAEEIFWGAAISMRNSSIQILENTYEKFTLFNHKDTCLNTILQAFRRHSRCSYLMPCFIFDSKMMLYKG